MAVVGTFFVERQGKLKKKIKNFGEYSTVERPWLHPTTQNLGAGDAYVETRTSAPSGLLPTACKCSHPSPGGGTTGEKCQHMIGFHLWNGFSLPTDVSGHILPLLYA